MWACTCSHTYANMQESIKFHIQPSKKKFDDIILASIANRLKINRVTHLQNLFICFKFCIYNNYIVVVSLSQLALPPSRSFISDMHQFINSTHFEWVNTVRV